MADVPGWLTAALEGRYTPECEIGRGGMATVYLATDIRHSRKVAIKILRSEGGRAVEAERFIREIEIAAKLVHPHILALHDSGVAGDLPYYVMPFIEGESIADRLRRTGPFEPDLALRLTTEIASALAYAHGRGLAHRDIKPGNILLVDGTHACVADFGLALAVSHGVDKRLTATGYSVGSPLYMSPEQIAGGAEVDDRTDVYSLGCVLYEMLTGDPPFTGGTVEEVLSRHLTAPMPPIGLHRPDVPERVDRIIRAMTAKRAQDRPPANHIAELLAGSRGVRLSTTTSTLFPSFHELSRRRSVQVATIGLLIAVALATAWRISLELPVGRRAAMLGPDSTRLLLLPFTTSAPDTLANQVRSGIRNAFAEWSGLSLVDELSTDATTGYPTTGLISEREAAALARRLGAGTVVRGTIEGASRGVNVTLVMSAGASNNTVARASALVDVPEDGGAYRELVARLLFPGTPEAVLETINSSTYPAVHAYLDGRAALSDWDATSAAAFFEAAVELDPSFPSAQVWLAQTRSWTGASGQERFDAVRRLRPDEGRLPVREQRLWRALSAMSNEDAPQACAIYDDMIADNPRDVVASIGLGECHRWDQRVVPDGSGEPRFRGGIAQATQAYARAFGMAPDAIRIFRGENYDLLRERLLMGTATLRAGFTASGDVYVGVLRVSADSVVNQLHPLSAIERGAAVSEPAATRRQRDVLHGAASRWARAEPTNAAALEALAVAQELLGDSSAVHSVRRSRQLTATAEARAQLAISEVWLGVKFSTDGSGNLPHVTAALADSLLAEPPIASGRQAERLASVAVLRGQPRVARRFAAAAVATPVDSVIPVSVSRLAEELMVFAALGGPADSIAALEDRVANAVRNSIDPRDRPVAERQLLSRPLSLAFPVYRSPRLSELASGDDYLISAQAALVRGDTALVRGILSTVGAQRTLQRPSDLRLEAIYPEACLWIELGQPEMAAEWLVPVLDALQWYPPGVLETVPAAGAWLLSHSLRSKLKADSPARFE